MTTLGIIDKLGGKTIVEVSKFWEGVNEIVSVISGAIFGFLPVGIIWSVSRKMGTSQILGIVLGICLVHPSLFSAYEYASHKAAGDVPHFILGFEKLVWILLALTEKVLWLMLNKVIKLLSVNN